MKDRRISRYLFVIPLLGFLAISLNGYFRRENYIGLAPSLTYDKKQVSITDKPNSPIHSTVSTTLDTNERFRKVVLFGPHDRYNFGDLLFTKVLLKLLQTRAGYRANEILFGGITSTDMTKYGGEEQILSMKKIQEMSREDKIQGPYDIVYTGGQSITCSHELAVSMLESEEKKASAMTEKVSDCGYLVPKSLLVPESEISNPSNLAVINSVGGIRGPSPACKVAIDTADYVAYRDHDPLYPDSAVMTKELYYDEINDAAKEVMNDLFPTNSQNITPMKYIAVQHKGNIMDDTQKLAELAESLDEVSRESNAIIVFFAGGTAPNHDSFQMYKAVASLMKQPSIVYEAENVWRVVGIISQAEAVLGTSLHVRIMALIYSKPRLTWCKVSKHTLFINLWEAEDAPRCVEEFSQTWSVLKDYYGPNPIISQDKTKVSYDKMVQKYMESFDKWSNLLRNKVRADS